MFYIYTIQNKVNNKLYVGWSGNYKERWKAEKKAAFRINGGDYNNVLSKAFRKYAKNPDDIENHFIFQVIEEFNDNEKAESHLAESYFIEFFRTNINRFGKDAGYNMTDGGELGSFGFKHSQETKDKISKIRKDNPNPPLIFTDEMRRKISQSKKGDGKKITQDIANNIRIDYKSGSYSLDDLNKKYKITVVRAIIYNEIWTDEKCSLTQLEIDEIKNYNYNNRKFYKINDKISQLTIDDIRNDFMNVFYNLSFDGACKCLIEKYENIKYHYMYKIIMNCEHKTGDVKYIHFLENKKSKPKGKLNQFLADQLRNDYNLMTILKTQTDKVKILSKKYGISIRSVYSVINNESWIKNES